MFRQFLENRRDRRILRYLQGVNDAPDVIIAIATGIHVVHVHYCLLRLMGRGLVTEYEGRYAIAGRLPSYTEAELGQVLPY